MTVGNVRLGDRRQPDVMENDRDKKENKRGKGKAVRQSMKTAEPLNIFRGQNYILYPFHVLHNLFNIGI